ncbi:MAG: hypothetical protein HZB91_15180 [Elusimicrobia bacterium]|nr:hypothetical protein [Elusimicrobiota bacterium]
MSWTLILGSLLSVLIVIWMVNLPLFNTDIAGALALTPFFCLPLGLILRQWADVRLKVHSVDPNSATFSGACDGFLAHVGESDRKDPGSRIAT